MECATVCRLRHLTISPQLMCDRSNVCGGAAPSRNATGSCSVRSLGGGINNVLRLGPVYLPLFQGEASIVIQTRTIHIIAAILSKVTEERL